jgi:hypothetical protein
VGSEEKSGGKGGEMWGQSTVVVNEKWGQKRKVRKVGSGEKTEKSGVRAQLLLI